MVLQSRLWAGRTLSTLMSAILGFGELGGEEEIRVKIRRVKKGRSFKRVLKSEDLAKIPLAEEGVGGACILTHTFGSYSKKISVRIRCFPNQQKNRQTNVARGKTYNRVRKMNDFLFARSLSPSLYYSPHSIFPLFSFLARRFFGNWESAEFFPPFLPPLSPSSKVGSNFIFAT